ALLGRGREAVMPSQHAGGSEGRERVDFWQSHDAPAIHGLSVKCSLHRWSLFHEMYALTLVKAGTGAWRCRGREKPIAPDTVLLIEPGDLHVTTAVASPASFETLYIDAGFMTDLAREGGFPGGFPHFHSIDSAAPALVHAFSA